MSEFAHGLDEDSLHWQNGYATREDAVADGETEHDESFVTGRVAHTKASEYLNIDISELFSGVADAVANNEGEWAEGYEAKWHDLADNGAKAAHTLLARFRAAFDEWAQEHGMTPDYFHVVDLEYHDAKPDEEPTDE